MFCVTWEKIEHFEKAVKLSKDLSLPLVDPLVEKDQKSSLAYFFLVSDGPLKLYPPKETGVSSPLYSDFLKGKMGYRLRHGIVKDEALAKAVGMKGDYKPSIIDATAGLGKDAFILAILGCKIHLIERSKIIAALLQDALQRAFMDQNISKKIKEENIEVSVGNSVEILEDLPLASRPDVIYLDPMFTERKKSALTKIEMRIIRDIVGDDEDAESLLEVSLKVAQKRVVVKRSLRIDPIPGRLPNFSLPGVRNRFDVYLT